jgi:hypothetical protein
LHLPRRLEALHDLLSSSGWLMGILRPVVEALVLPMLDARHDLTFGSGVAAQLVGDQHPRRSPRLLQELAEQAFGGLLAAPAKAEHPRNEWKAICAVAAFLLTAIYHMLRDGTV